MFWCPFSIKRITLKLEAERLLRHGEVAVWWCVDVVGKVRTVAMLRHGILIQPHNYLHSRLRPTERTSPTGPTPIFISAVSNLHKNVSWSVRILYNYDQLFMKFFFFLSRRDGRIFFFWLKTNKIKINFPPYDEWHEDLVVIVQYHDWNQSRRD
jgi:hypothetical protein